MTLASVSYSFFIHFPLFLVEMFGSVILHRIDLNNDVTRFISGKWRCWIVLRVSFRTTKMWWHLLLYLNATKSIESSPVTFYTTHRIIIYSTLLIQPSLVIAQLNRNCSFYILKNICSLFKNGMLPTLKCHFHTPTWSYRSKLVKSRLRYIFKSKSEFKSSN